MNIPVVQYRFPKRVETTSEEKVRQFFNRENTGSTWSVWTFLEQRAEAKEKIKNHIKNGTIVIVDRYCASGIAYGTAYGLDINCCKAMKSKILKPDLTLFFNNTVRVAFMKVGFGPETFDSVKYQREVLVVQYQIRESTWVAVDATKSKQCHWRSALQCMNFLTKRASGCTVYPPTQ